MPAAATVVKDARFLDRYVEIVNGCHGILPAVLGVMMVGEIMGVTNCSQGLNENELERG